MAVHAPRQYMNGATHRRVLLKIDARKEFNCLRRDVILRVAPERASNMYKLLWQAYHQPKNLNFSNNVIKSQCSAQQGDLLGRKLFPLRVGDITKSDDAEFNN